MCNMRWQMILKQWSCHDDIFECGPTQAYKEAVLDIEYIYKELRAGDTIQFFLLRVYRVYSDWEPNALRLEKTYSAFQNRTANTNTKICLLQLLVVSQVVVHWALWSTAYITAWTTQIITSRIIWFKLHLTWRTCVLILFWCESQQEPSRNHHSWVLKLML